MIDCDSDSRIIKASFKDCSLEDRKLFHKSKCIMPISVGQKIHEGNKFLAVINLINNSFKYCTILVDDSVQRHTMKILDFYSDDSTLYKLAVEEGDAWLRRNKFAYEKLTIPYKIMRWDDWLKSSYYQSSYLKINELYNNNAEYKQKIHANITDFLSRYISRFENKELDYNRAFSLCLDYLKEECAVMCLWVNEECEFEVYPSGRNGAMTATYEHLIKPIYSNLLKSVALRFKKYPGKFT